MLRQNALSSNGFLTSFAQPNAFRAVLTDTNGAPVSYLASTFQPYNNLTDLYFAEAAGDENMNDACAAVGATLDGALPGAQVVESNGGRVPGMVEAASLTCNGFGDVAAALVGMHPNDVWITRLEADLTRPALAQDLTLMASASQGYVPNWHLASTSIGSPCPPVTTGTASSPSQGGNFTCAVRPSFAGRAALGFAAFGVAFLLRRAAGRRRRPQR
jgi:hypothetical protein